MCDITNSGLGILFDGPLATGQTVEVRFALRCRVAWVGEPGLGQKSKVGLEIMDQD